MPASDADVTRLLADLGAGHEGAFDALLPEVFETLKQIAHRQLRNERDGHTLNTTALVHEAYLKLVGHENKDWHSRAHFFGVAARAMRRVLVSYARGRNAEKRGGDAIHVTLDENQPPLDDTRLDDLVAVNDALETLEALNPRWVRVVECRFFVGLTIEETAEVLGVSPVTVARDWRAARAWLRHHLASEGPSE